MCGCPFNSTWVKKIKAGKFTGWPILKKYNVAKYSRDHQDTKRTIEPNQENVRSTKPKSKPFEKAGASTL